MTEAECNERIAALEQKKKGLERNRNICVLLAFFLGYNVWKSIQEGTPPLWFYECNSFGHNCGRRVRTFFIRACAKRNL